MSSKGFLNLLKRCRDLGYEVNLLYVWVSDVELAVQRVRHRVLTGGHNIPEEMIRRRYFRSAHNFLNFYQNLADRWMVCDNSSLAPYLLAQKKPDQNEPEIYNTSVWDMFRGLKHEKQRA